MQKTSEQSIEDCLAEIEYLSQVKQDIQQLIQQVQQCQERCADSPQARAVKQEVTTLLQALKVRCLLPYEAQALSRPKDITKCSVCGKEELVARMVPIVCHPQETRRILHELSEMAKPPKCGTDERCPNSPANSDTHR